MSETPILWQGTVDGIEYRITSYIDEDFGTEELQLWEHDSEWYAVNHAHNTHVMTRAILSLGKGLKGKHT